MAAEHELLLAQMEDLTVRAESDCETDMKRALARIEERGKAVAAFARLELRGDSVPPHVHQRLLALLLRSQALENRVLAKRAALVPELATAARQRRFSQCLTGVAGAPPHRTAPSAKK
jgi:hypothetical protein